MSDVAIRCEGLGKRYRIGARPRYKALRDTLAGVLSAPFRRAASLLPGSNHQPANAEDTIWALKDVSFEVKRGEVVGIIGRNGAGKTTLLKILSRITEPTAGRAEIYGRIASLLEVGTGFHPELTGRENIYLNGAILGMRKAEIDRRLDEIVAFSEVEKFIDTPVKHFSSGMYVRLAFAVAAHLEPEILLVDEILAVGDLAFQKKCLDKVGEVSRGGRTVVFVSHNMGAVTGLCRRGLFLEEGHIAASGGIGEVISEYVARARSSGERSWGPPDSAPGDDTVRLKAVYLMSDGEVTGNVRIDRDVLVHIEFFNHKPGSYLAAGIQLLDGVGNAVLASANLPSVCLVADEWAGRPYPVGLFRSSCRIPANFLNEGRYSVNVVMLSGNLVRLRVDEAVSFSVHETGAMRKEFTAHWIGVVRPRLEWLTECQARPVSR